MEKKMSVEIQAIKDECIKIEKLLPFHVKKWEEEVYDVKSKKQIYDHHKYLERKKKEYDYIINNKEIINTTKKELILQIIKKESEIKELKHKLKHVERDLMVETISEKNLSEK